MNLENMSDEFIINFIAQNLEKKRLSEKITSEELAEKGGYNSQTYSNFVNKNTNIRMITFIQILRGLGALDILEKIEYKEEFSPYRYKNKIALPKRVKTNKGKVINKIKWGDEE